MDHPLVRLTQEVDWNFIETRLGAGYRQGNGQPALPRPTGRWPVILQHVYNLSDEALRARWVEDPYSNYLCLYIFT